MATTQDIEKARKLVGTYCKHEMTRTVYRIIGFDSLERRFTLYGLHEDRGICATSYPNWSMSEYGNGPGGTIPISRDEYLATAAPLFAELAKLAGVERAGAGEKEAGR